MLDGLPGSARALASIRAPIAAAAASAAKIPTPPPLTESQFASLTGPGSPLAGVFRAYLGLVAHGWTQIAAAVGEAQHGTPAAAHFARENVALYIESVYDGQFDLAQIGKQLQRGYRELGGPAAFGGALTQTEVRELEGAYCEATALLRPRARVRLGS